MMNRIKQLREEREIKQSELAKMVGCAANSLSNYENENRALTPALINRFCDIFHVSADYLLCRTSMPSAELSEGEYALIRAYRAADDRAKKVVRLTLEPFDREKG